MHITTSLLLALLSTPTTLCLAKPTTSKPSSAILLSKVRTLTLRDGKLTTHRRVPALPQLRCVGGNAQDLHTIDVMRCENSGAEYDAEDIAWTCKAALPPEFKLGSTEVVCEGYDDAEDPFVLKGSCAVEYRLLLTEVGERKFPERMGRAWRRKNAAAEGKGEGSEWLAGVVFWLIFGGIVIAILYSIFFGSPDARNPANPRNRNNRNRRPGAGGWGGGGGGGGDDNDDPPPPYTPRAPPRGGKSSTTSSTNSFNRASQGQNQAWRPGFWTGTAAGAAAGYAARGWNDSRRGAATRGTNASTNAQAGPSNWFGGGGGGAGSSGAGASSSPPSSSRHESTGFGGTRRR